MTELNWQAAAALAIVIVAILLLWKIAWIAFRMAVLAAYALPGTAFVSRAWNRSHPMRALLQQHYPRGYEMARRRVSPDRFEGLPLTLIIAAALYLAALLGGLVEDVLEAEEIVVLDDAISAFFQPLRGSFLVPLFLWVTNLGAQPALAAVAIISTGFLWADRRGSLILPLWIAIIGAEATTWIGKFGFDRTRPHFTTAAIASSPSFPSAHTTGAIAVYGFVAYAIARDVTTARQRFEVIYWATALIASIAFSRAFLGVHFASDVAAGLLVGAFWLLVAFSIAEIRRSRAPDPGDVDKT